MTLRHYLDSNGLSTAAFGRRCGLSQPYVWEIANGRMPSMRAAVRIHRATNGEVGLEDLAGDELREPLRAGGS